MWQSRVEIEHYSVVYFDRITAFEVLQKVVVSALVVCCGLLAKWLRVRVRVRAAVRLGPGNALAELFPSGL